MLVEWPLAFRHGSVESRSNHDVPLEADVTRMCTRRTRRLLCREHTAMVERQSSAATQRGTVSVEPCTRSCTDLSEVDRISGGGAGAESRPPPTIVPSPGGFQDRT